MEQFSHDLTLALEETSRFGENRNRWGLRRRTRSTGNLPCAPQPTEDSSSSPADQHEFNTSQNSPQLSGTNNLFQSDSDDKHSLAFAFRSRQTPLTGNFESDSFNENFSPARPNLRRKRKFKRMAVGYEASLSSSSVANSSIFPAILKKRAFNHENLRANLIFCGKRKRSHRDRYVDYETYKQHSNSVPRQRDLFAPKSLSYLECKGRNRAASFTSGVSFNKNIISKIEKMSQERNLKLCFQFSTPFNKRIDLPDGSEESNSKQEVLYNTISNISSTSNVPTETTIVQNSLNLAESCRTHKGSTASVRKSTGFESMNTCLTRPISNKHNTKSHKVKHSRRQEQMQSPYDDRMNCPNMSELLSSSSLSSSDSEAINTNESDHEGDDELTDWPGNEGMINFTSKNDFKRLNKTRVMKPSLPQIKQQDDIQDDDTLMSTDDTVIKPLNFEVTTLGTAHNNLNSPKCSPGSSEDLPLNKSTSTFSIQHMDASSSSCQAWLVKKNVQDEVASTFFTPPNIYTEIREIRAGCRRIRDERPGFSIISSANELLSRFLQNDQQQVLTLFDINATEYDKLYGLSKLYSLTMQVENGCVILNKTSNTMQSIRIDQTKLPKTFCDFKRRCYGDSVDVDFNNLPN
ncbi:uncharacterized protein LOC128742386 [Sabethes cyaneus]|uniref:uncharacterized protein LOC128742386 n=1 Tax=Sabethes cyaneus TaxID=53552 RepID=UPI00237DF909|nr:uncharacterized protein LOC128742386 [Sabethes cyaneus]XP_053694706.1 uncharacterized protein LOC128742386 [Sabethes cyaneus]XP_053694707.1 uncharacterized protein LOC128742386 [Sabethes cyaneus]